MLFLFIIGSLLLLLLLILVVRLHPFLALTLTAIALGFANGMAPMSVIKSVQKGMGDTLGGVVLVLGLGIVLGRILTESGGAQRLSTTLTHSFGMKRVKYALLLTSFVVGLAMFYNAGFIVMLPLVLSIAAQTQLPVTYLAIIMASALSVTHGFLPPHPGPTTIAEMFNADIGRTLLYGLIISVPTLLLAGVWFPEWLKKRIKDVPSPLFAPILQSESALPGFGKSFMAALLPVLLTGSVAIFNVWQPLEKDAVMPQWRSWLSFVGDPSVAMLLAVLFAFVFLCTLEGKKMKWVNVQVEAGIGSVAGILLIIAAGGGFKQILSDSGIGNELSGVFEQSSLPPLILAWLVASVVRVTIGSATLAGMTTGGLMAPFVLQGGVNAELMVLSIGAGSLMFSHVNDSGFWMFKESFGLTIKETILSWSLMETIVSVAGLIGVLLLDFLV